MSSNVTPLFYRPDLSGFKPIPMAGSTVPAGFPSPADDHLDKKLNLNEYLVARPMATFFIRARGYSMTGAGIMDNALLVVDRSIEPRDGHIVVALLDNEFTVKRLKKKWNKVMLVAENDQFTPIELHEGQQLEIWGVVTHVINSMV